MLLSFFAGFVYGYQGWSWTKHAIYWAVIADVVLWHKLR